MKRIPGLTYANVVATIALFVALGGGAIAASHLGKNAVGPKQLKKNAVTTAKVKKEAITAAKVKKGTLTGTQINSSTLGTVPTANLANSIAPPEAVHVVGSPGEPGFQNGWSNGPPAAVTLRPVGFYKDHEGVVHLQGLAVGGAASKVVFQLPPGYRPGPGKVLGVSALCNGCGGGVGPMIIFGSNSPAPSGDGAVLMPAATGVGLDGITFRAES